MHIAFIELHLIKSDKITTDIDTASEVSMHAIREIAWFAIIFQFNSTKGHDC